ncbi:MAG: YaaL family protein [Anaerovoracaceae bacterium]|jgi:hypothetical protein
MGTPLEGIKNIVEKAYHQILNVPEPINESEELKLSIQEAQQDWRRAERIFSEATDPDLVDYAIYDMLAAKTRYSYLIKTAKKKGLIE